MQPLPEGFITPEMLDVKIDELKSSAISLTGDDLIRAYENLSRLAPAPHQFYIHDEFQFPDSTTEIAGPVPRPVPKPRNESGFPVLIPQSRDTSQVSAMMVGPVGASSITLSTTVSVTCPRCQKSISITVK